MIKNRISRNLVISLFANRQELTVDDAANYLSIPASTVSGIFYRLEKKGIIAKNGTINIGKGRPVHCYRLNLTGVVAACKFDGTEVLGGVLDEQLNILALEKISIKGIYTLEQAGEVLGVLLNRFEKASGVSKEKFDGVGIAINAVQIGGRVFMSSVLPWAEPSMGKKLSHSLGTKVKLINSPVVLAEYQKTDGEIPNSLVRFIVGDGVSAHSIVNGKLLEGSSVLAGELGHIIVDPNGPLCGCGRRGCLEAYCSGLAIRDDIVRNLKSGVNSVANYEILESNSPREAVNQIWKMWKAGDTFIKTYMDRIFGWLGWGLGIVVNILDPDIVRFGGYVLRGREEWMQSVLSKAEQWILNVNARNTLFEPSRVTIEDELRALGTSFYYQEQ